MRAGNLFSSGQHVFNQMLGSSARLFCDQNRLKNSQGRGSSIILIKLHEVVLSDIKLSRRLKISSHHLGQCPVVNRLLAILATCYIGCCKSR